jgi:mannose-6-phosphate isomerase
MTPLLLAPNLVEHFYLGGEKIAALRGVEPPSARSPEEWVAATVSRFGDDAVGLARTVDGDLVRDLVAADPRSWVGPEAAAAGRAGAADTGLLVKLLDAGARLPVHVHPDRSFALRHLDCPYGKTEAWHVLQADAGAAVYLGWTEDLDPEELARRRDAQDSEWMLERLHRVPVRAGDGILVPAGTAHAIGEGVFLVETQEPTDLSIVLEWSVTTSTREESHLGVGFDAAMTAVTHSALAPDALAALCRHVAPEHTGTTPEPCLPPAALPFFRLDVVAPPSGSAGAGCPVAAGYAVLVVLDGEGELVAEQGSRPVSRGDTLVVPAAFGDWQARGPVRMLLARPGVGWPGALSVEEPR